MLTIAPPPVGSIARISERRPRKVPRTLLSITRSNSAGSRSASGVGGGPFDALLNAATSRSTEAGSVTSVPTASACPPLSRMPAATSARARSSREPSTTAAPASANARAVTALMPRLAPATSATFPTNGRWSVAAVMARLPRPRPAGPAGALRACRRQGYGVVSEPSASGCARCAGRRTSAAVRRGVCGLSAARTTPGRVRAAGRDDADPSASPDATPAVDLVRLDLAHLLQPGVALHTGLRRTVRALGLGAGLRVPHGGGDVRAAEGRFRVVQRTVSVAGLLGHGHLHLGRRATARVD